MAWLTGLTRIAITAVDLHVLDTPFDTVLTWYLKSCYDIQ